MNKNKDLVIGLAGFGTVGSGLINLLESNKQLIQRRIGRNIFLKSVLVRDKAKLRPQSLPHATRFVNSIHDLSSDPEIDVVVELMGGLGLAGELIGESLKAGKDVVTANKALLAEKGFGLFELAGQKGRTLGYEASVCGAIPIIKTLQDSLAANQILSVVGILNGTSNYILSEMSSHKTTFAESLRLAQEKGYAEADPTLDIEGFDAAHKLTLLIRLAFGVDYSFEDIFVQGIASMDIMDIEFAREFGYRIKLLGQVYYQNGRLEAAVLPTLVPHTLLLARVGGVYNAVRVEGNASGPIFLHGQGAGGPATASAVLGDILNIARGAQPNNTGFVVQKLEKADMISHAEQESQYYMRVMVRDVPGTLRDLAGIMAENDMSVAQAIQKESGHSEVPLVFMTHKAKAKSIRRAVEEMKARNLVKSEPVCYRVLQR